MKTIDQWEADGNGMENLFTEGERRMLGFSNPPHRRILALIELIRSIEELQIVEVQSLIEQFEERMK